MTWQTNFLIASSKPSTLVTRSACMKMDNWTVSKEVHHLCVYLFYFYLSVNLLPEHLELTHLQQISKVKQSLHLEDETVSRKDRMEEFNSQVDPKITWGSSRTSWLRRHLHRTKSVWGRLARAFSRIFTTTCILSGTFNICYKGKLLWIS